MKMPWGNYRTIFSRRPMVVQLQGAPDKNDWIIDCGAQTPVYQSVQNAIVAVEALM